MNTYTKRKNFFFFLFILIGILSTSVFALDLSQTFNHFFVKSITGNESKVFNVEIDGLNICLTPKIIDGQEIEETYIECIDYPKGHISLDGSEQNCTEQIIKTKYYIPDYVPINDLSADTIISPLTKNLENKFCYSVINPYLMNIIKFGLNSIIIEGDISYNSTDVNITQFTGGANLETPQELTSEMTLHTEASTLLHLNNLTNYDSTTIAYDSATGNNNGTLSGGATWNCTGAKLGDCALYFDDNNNLVTFDADVEDVVDDKVWSMAYWYKSLLGTGGLVFGAREFGASNLDEVRIGTGGATYDDDPVNYAVSFLEGGVDTLDGNWHHFVVTMSATEMVAYVDGVWTNSTNTTSAGNLNLDCNNAFLGCRSYTCNPYADGNANWLDGLIDEYALWDKTLTEDEVLTLYNQTYTKYGSMRFDNINLGTNNTLNLSIADCELDSLTNISMQIGNGDKFNLTDCNHTDYNLSSVSDLTNTNLTLFFYGNNSFTGTPTIFGNITLDAWEITNKPPVVNLVYPEDDSEISWASNSFNLVYNTTDEDGTINQCSLWLGNGTLSLIDTDTSITEDTNQTFSIGVSNGFYQYDWLVECMDDNLTKTNSSTYHFNLSVSLPPPDTTICQGKQDDEDIPCDFLTNNIYFTNCTEGYDYNVTYLNSTSTLYLNGTLNLTKYTGFGQFEFNLTNHGTYVIRICDGTPAGTIIVYDEDSYDKSFYFYVFLLIIPSLLIILAIKLDDNPLFIIAGFVLCIFGIYIQVNGFPNFENALVKLGAFVLLMCLGFYLIIKSVLKMLEGY